MNTGATDRAITRYLAAYRLNKGIELEAAPEQIAAATGLSVAEVTAGLRIAHEHGLLSDALIINFSRPEAEQTLEYLEV